MKEINNSTLALFVVMAIVVSVFGTLLSLNKLNQLGDTSITGMLSTTATQTGTANLTVPSVAAINLTNNTVELGVIPVEEYNDSYNKDDYFRVRNDGTVNVSIQVKDASQLNQGLVDRNGTGPFTSITTSGGCLATTPATCFMIWCNKTQSGRNCNTTDKIAMRTEYTTVFLWALNSSDGSDVVWFGVNATVPRNEPSGKKQTVAVSFLATDDDS